VEKYLKAYLIAQGNTPPRIHDLEELLNLCALYDATLTTRLPLVQIRNPYAVLIRHPGMTATRAEAKEAVHALRRLRIFLRRTLGTPYTKSEKELCNL
jgi:HEPN domain-containing protein